MEVLIQGIGYGLLLTILVGPIFLALLQTSIDYGLRAGAAVGLGIWFSDFLFIALVYSSVALIENQAAWQATFQFIMGTLGGAILMLVGLGFLFSAPPDVKKSKAFSASSYLGFFTKGFLVNTINPFTIFFWITVTTDVVLKKGYDSTQAFLFFLGILGTISLTDFFKVFLAKQLRTFLQPVYLIWIRRFSGSLLVLLGGIMMIRGIFF